MTLKILFTDIDGVLNNYRWLKQRGPFTEETTREEHQASFFDPENVTNLNKICDKTGAKIVVSSSWRKGKTVEQLQDLFERVGVTGEVIDKTIALRFANWTHSVPRGVEILHWMNTNKGILGTNLLRWKDYAIIDDDTDMLYWQRKNLFTTEPEVGLTANMAYRIINHLL